MRPGPTPEPPFVEATPTRPARVVVVGAGAAGLTAAALLAERHDVIVLDKGRGVGGRLATRRLGGATFDHGAQFVTTHGDRFASTVAGWVDAGVATPWYHGLVGPHGVGDGDGHTRYRGTVSMNAVAKHLAVGLDVRTGVRVAALSVLDGGWRVDPAGEQSALRADALVVTAPVPQTLELLAAGGVRLTDADAAALHHVAYDPCLAVMAALDEPAGLPAPGAVAPEDGVLDWIADNQAKGVSAEPALTVHVGASASRAWWEDEDEVVVRRALDAARAATGRPLRVVGHSVQRWRYARPSAGHSQPCLVAGGLPPLVVVGDAFGEAKVEGAVGSGAAGAEALRVLLER